MNDITHQLNIKLASLPFYTDLGRMTGKINLEMLLYHFRNNGCKFLSFFRGRKGDNQLVYRCIVNDLVINRILQTEKQENLHQILAFNHDNIEKILYHDESDKDFFIWITPLFVTKLKTVWEKNIQFKYGVKNMFHDLLNGLEYMKSKNIASGVIHEDNLAYNGHCWYISGIVNAEKAGECSSGVYTSISLKSRRHLCDNTKFVSCFSFAGFSTGYIPEDDLWQLLLMYVITYYGFNPFQERRSIFLPKDTISADFILQSDISEKIRKGLCQDITLRSIPDHFGKILKNLLTSVHLNNDSYKLFRYIIENNGTSNTQNLDTLVQAELKSAVELQNALEQENSGQIITIYTEKELRQNVRILTASCYPLSFNIDQYIEKFKECECIVCFSKTIYYKFSPCNHEICCHGCYTRLNPKKCPMCRQSINSIEKLTTERIKTLNTERQTLYVNITSY